MAVNLNVVIGGVAKVVAATSYAFPKKGNLPADYTLTLNGEKAVLARTGGGEKYPTYIYVMIDGKSHYLPKNVTPDAGSDMTVIATPAKVEEKLASIEDRGPEGLEDLLPKVEAEVKPAKPARRKAAK